MISNDDMDDLVDEWHLDYDGPLELVDFLSNRTGLSCDEVVHWIETAELPLEE